MKHGDTRGEAKANTVTGVVLASEDAWMELRLDNTQRLCALIEKKSDIMGVILV